VIAFRPPSGYRLRLSRRGFSSLLAAAGLVSALASCALRYETPPQSPAKPTPPAAAAAVPAVPPAAAAGYAFKAEVGDLFDLAQGRAVPIADLAPRLAQARIVFIGEAHDERSSRHFQMQVIESLVAQGRDVFVALEMLSPAANDSLADWSRGRLSEKEFLARSGWYDHWGFPWVLYRDLFLDLRDKRLPIRGINVTAEQRRLAGEGKLDPALRDEVGELDLEVEPHQRFLADALRDSGHPGNPDFGSPEFQRFLRVQVLWDQVMGTRAARLVQAGSSRAVVVVLIGSGHVEYKLGANLRAARVRPELPQLTLVHRFVVAEDLAPDGRAAVAVGLADFVRLDRHGESSAKPGSLSALRLFPAPGGIGVDSGRGFPRGASERFQPGDLIRSLNGVAYADPIDLRLAYESIPPDGSAEWVLERSGKEIRVKAPIHPKK